MKFSVVGLGNEKNQITLEGLEVVKSADVVVVKTALTPTVETLAENGVQFVSCDFCRCSVYSHRCAGCRYRAGLKALYGHCAG